MKITATDWPLVESSMKEWREWAMATQPCSPINHSGGPQGKGKPLPKPAKPTSPGSCSNPSNG